MGGNQHIKIFQCDQNSQTAVLSLDGHTNNITSIGFQRDRKWMYSGSEDCSVKIWDVRAAGYQRDYTSQYSINTVVLHPNQAELISGDDDANIKVYDLQANKIIYTYTIVQESNTHGRHPIRSLCIAVDASILIAANNAGQVYCFKLNNSTTPSHNTTNTNQSLPYMELIHKFDAHSTYCLKALLSPDVRILATSSADKTIKLWNVNESILHNTTNNNDKTNLQPSYTTDTTRTTTDTTATADNKSSIINSSIDPLITPSRTLSGHSGWVWDVSFSADSAYLVSASSDKTAKLWDVRTGDVILEYRGHQKAITSIALNDAS